jgi:hypothetical protein
MTDAPNDAAPPPAADAEQPVDTSPAPPERTAVTYGILIAVLAALGAYFLLHYLRR